MQTKVQTKWCWKHYKCVDNHVVDKSLSKPAVILSIPANSNWFYKNVSLLPRSPLVCRKMSAWMGQYEQLKRFCLWTKIHQFFSPNVEGVAVDKILFPFGMCGSVPEIFESCQKSRRIVDVFSLPNFRGPAFQKLYRFNHHYLTARRLEKVLWGYSH